MRIAIVTTDVREFRRDYTGTIATFGTAPTALLQGLAQLPEAEIHVLSCARQRMKSQEKLAKNIWFHSIHVPKLGWMRTGYQGCIRAVRQQLRAIEPDLVHGQGTELDCALDAVFSGFPNVVTLHGNMRAIARVHAAKPFSFHWLAARLERLVLPRSDGVVCISNYTRHQVEGLARRCWVIPNAVHDSFFGIDSQPFATARMLCVGVISALKNQNAFILALDGLTKEFNFEVVFLGDGRVEDPYFSEFQQLVNARRWCTHAGFVGRDQLQDHLRQATLLALPSLEENCPMVLLEAMAAQVPIVASNVGGVPDLIRDGETGLLCAPLDRSSMLGAVRRIISDRAATREMAVRAKAFARESFRPEIVARRHLEVYREVLSKDV